MKLFLVVISLLSLSLHAQSSSWMPTGKGLHPDTGKLHPKDGKCRFVSVDIEVKKYDLKSYAHGVGWVIAHENKEDFYILTPSHVVSYSDAVEKDDIITIGCKDNKIKAVLHADSPTLDLALLKIEGKPDFLKETFTFKKGLKGYKKKDIERIGWGGVVGVYPGTEDKMLLLNTSKDLFWQTRKEHHLLGIETGLVFSAVAVHPGLSGTAFYHAVKNTDNMIELMPTAMVTKTEVNGEQSYGIPTSEILTYLPELFEKKNPWLNYKNGGNLYDKPSLFYSMTNEDGKIKRKRIIVAKDGSKNIFIEESCPLELAPSVSDIIPVGGSGDAADGGGSGDAADGSGSRPKTSYEVLGEILELQTPSGFHISGGDPYTIYVRNSNCKNPRLEYLGKGTFQSLKAPYYSRAIVLGDIFHYLMEVHDNKKSVKEFLENYAAYDHSYDYNYKQLCESPVFEGKKHLEITGGSSVHTSSIGYYPVSRGLRATNESEEAGLVEGFTCYEDGKQLTFAYNDLSLGLTVALHMQTDVLERKDGSLGSATAVVIYAEIGECKVQEIFTLHGLWNIPFETDIFSGKLYLSTDPNRPFNLAITDIKDGCIDKTGQFNLMSIKFFK